MINISFWGSPFISARLLETLLKCQNVSVKFVVTREDKPRAARGREYEPTPVKKIAQLNNIPVFTPKSLKINSGDLLDKVAKQSVDANVVFAYGKIIPEQFFSLPPHGTVNFHASLLPILRGASPIEHSLLLGHEKTGWTMQKMVEKLDAGDIYYTSEVPIKWDDNFSSLAERLMNQLLLFSSDILEKYIQGELIPVAQSDSEATLCGKIDNTAGKVNWQDDVFHIRNTARAFSERGGIHTFFLGKKCKIFPDLSVTREEILKSSHIIAEPGVVSRITDEHIWIACANNTSLPIASLQPEGKKKLSTKDFVNGYRVKLHDKTG
ncbi:MAG: methionyl-tRNA formyltransferase [Spirochaetia bacterium]|nr:methionyl-tRNA formyltransferase [Spirochaetia bacterium]